MNPFGTQLLNVITYLPAVGALIILIGFRRASRETVARFATVVAGLGFLVRAGNLSLFADITGLIGQLAQAVRNIVNNVQTADVLHVQQVDRVGLFLAEYRHQHVGSRDFLLATGLHVENRSLQYALKTEGWLNFLFLIIVRMQTRRGFIYEPLQIFSKTGHISTRRFQNTHDRRYFQQREQQMLNRHEFVALIPRAPECFIQTELEFTAQHLSVFLHGAKQRVLTLT